MPGYYWINAGAILLMTSVLNAPEEARSIGADFQSGFADDAAGVATNAKSLLMPVCAACRSRIGHP